MPFPYRFVNDVDMKIYDRWGIIVFKTTDPNIGWDGKNYKSGRDCPDGVYYYVCKVNELYLSGVKSRYVYGFIEMIR